MFLAGYVSDERDLALADVVLEFIGAAGSFEARSRATGSVYVDLPAGVYEVALQKPGYGPKRTTLELAPERPPARLRLLSDGLLGYAWPKWVKGGDRGEFRVHAVEPYELSLYRMGLVQEHVQSLGWHDEHGPRATVQTVPDGDFTRTGVGWNEQGYVNPILHQKVRAPERSGLYYFHARTRSGARFGFPWIVAPARPTTALAVLASNITWNAYNNFGGRSNYISPDGLPDRPTVNARHDLGRYTLPGGVVYRGDGYDPLSFDRPEPCNDLDRDERPLDPIKGRAACHLAPAEWRLLAWLEREGFAYDYYAETQLHHGTLDLDAYRVLVISTHPEYWTRVMYMKVKEWVHKRGGRLVYLGGNGLNCEVELVDPAAAVYQNGDARGLGDRGLESRFHARVESEASLLGVVFTEAGAMTGAPYRVIQPGHWAFAGTGLSEGDLFGKASLHERCPGGASAHETDKISPHSPPNTQLLAKGTNRDHGGAELACYETESQGVVFAAGSIAWPSSILVDKHASRITANVLRRFLVPGPH